MDREVSIQNLMLLDFPSEVLTPQMQEWRAEKGIPYAMSCSRNIWYGHCDDFQDFPFPASRARVRVMEQEQAYANMIRAVVGEYILQVKRGLKINTNGQAVGYRQFYDGFDLFKRDKPDQATHYQGLYDQLSDDIDFVRDTYAEKFKRLSFDRAALELAGHKKGDEVLVVGHRLAAGNISTNMKALLVIAAEMNPQGTLTVTHPDDEALGGIAQTCKKLKSSGELNADISFRPFSEFPQLIERSDHVLSCLPMGSNMEAEIEMSEAWKGRVRRDNTITAMQRDHENLQASYDIWDNGGLDNYFTPEQISNEVKRVVSENNQLLARIEAVYAECGHIRFEGGVPREALLLSADEPRLSVA